MTDITHFLVKSASRLLSLRARHFSMWLFPISNSVGGESWGREADLGEVFTRQGRNQPLSELHFLVLPAPARRPSYSLSALTQRPFAGRSRCVRLEAAWIPTLAALGWTTASF